MIVKVDTGDYFKITSSEDETIVEYYSLLEDGEYELIVTMTFKNKEEALKALDSYDDIMDLL